MHGAMFLAKIVTEYLQCYWHAFGLGMLFMFLIGELYGKWGRQRV